MESTLPPPATKQPVPDWLRDLGWEEVYEVRRLIARGGMGRVYEGWHRTLCIPVALKIIDPHLIGEDHIRARFEKEAMTLARLQEPVPHPNIVRVLDFKLLDNVGCIVMAYIRGMDLRAWCVDEDLGTQARVGLIEQVARAAGYFHSFGLVHRDLKPANVLVREGCGEPVIVDFGIVRGREDVTLTRTQQALGTAAYMAPEMLGVKSVEKTTLCTNTDTDTEATAQGLGEISPTADVYSLGVILYELLYGELPYGRTMAEVLPKHQKESPPEILNSGPRRIHRDLERVCLKAIAHRPSERYANGTALAEDLARHQRGEPVQARPISKIRHAARRARQRPLLCMAAGAGIVMALLAVTRLIWDIELVKLARLREEIGFHMPAAEWSSDHVLKVDRLIDQLSVHDPDQADIFHRNLIKGAAREVENDMKQPRITEAGRAEIARVIGWIRSHDAAEADRLQAIFEARMRSWETLLEVKPPFAKLGSVFAGNQAVTKDGQFLRPNSSKNINSLAIEPHYPTPLEASATFLPGGAASQFMGMRITLDDGRAFDFRYYQPVPTNAIKHALQSRHPTGELAPAALVISDRHEILAVAPLQQTATAGQPLRLTVHGEGSHLSLQIDNRPPLQHRLKYQIDGTAQITLQQQPVIQIQDLRWSGVGHSAKPSPLERGDALAAQKNWSAAENAFLQLASDAAFGQEALYKAGDCQMEEGHVGKATQTWQQVMAGPDTEWRRFACLQLWMLHAEAGRLKEARGYLDMIPGQKDLPEGYIDWIKDSKKLSDRYRAQARGLNLLRPIPEVEDAIRVHQMLNYPAPDLAARFALARHFNGADEATRGLLRAGLKPVHPENLTVPQTQTLNTCLELRTLTALHQKDQEMVDEIDSWLKFAPPGHSVAWTVKIEQARRLARDGQEAKAIDIARQVLHAEQSTIMAFTGAALLLSALDADPDHAAILYAIARIPEAGRQIQELTLTNRILLHSVAKNWTDRSMVEVLGNYLSLGVSGEEHDILRGRISRSLLENKAMLMSLNHLLDGQTGRALLQSFALRHEPFRELTHQWFYAVLRRYVIYSAFGEASTPEQLKTAAQVVHLWLKAYAERQITDDEFIVILESWRDSQPSIVLKSLLARLPEPLRKTILQVFQARSS